MKKKLVYLCLFVLTCTFIISGCRDTEKKVIRVRNDKHSSNAVIPRVRDGGLDYISDEYCNMLVQKFDKKIIKIGDVFTMQELCGEINTKSFKKSMRVIFADICAAEEDYKAALDDPLIAEQEVEMEISFTSENLYINYTGYQYYEEGKYGNN